jgi:hypothetical protein
LRIKNRIATGLAEKRWVLGSDLAPACRDALPPGFAMDGERVRATA